MILHQVPHLVRSAPANHPRVPFPFLQVCNFPSRGLYLLDTTRFICNNVTCNYHYREVSESIPQCNLTMISDMFHLSSSYPQTGKRILRVKRNYFYFIILLSSGSCLGQLFIIWWLDQKLGSRRKKNRICQWHVWFTNQIISLQYTQLEVTGIWTIFVNILPKGQWERRYLLALSLGICFSFVFMVPRVIILSVFMMY